MVIFFGTRSIIIILCHCVRYLFAWYTVEFIMYNMVQKELKYQLKIYALRNSLYFVVTVGLFVYT
jgi:hypothetical protein